MKSREPGEGVARAEEVGLVENLGENVGDLVLAADPLRLRDFVQVLLTSVHEELLVVTRACGGAGVLPAVGGDRVSEDGHGQIESDAEELERLLHEAEVLGREDVGINICLPRRLGGDLHQLGPKGDGGATKKDGTAAEVPRVPVPRGVLVDLERRGARVVEDADVLDTDEVR